MAGQISQSESQVVYRRLAAVAVQLLGLKEEVARLKALNTSVDLSANLDEESGGHLTKAQALAFVTEMLKYEEWFDNTTVAATIGEGDPARRATMDPLILAEPLV
jgi:hypothetical protein